MKLIAFLVVIASLSLGIIIGFNAGYEKAKQKNTHALRLRTVENQLTNVVIMIYEK